MCMIIHQIANHIESLVITLRCPVEGPFRSIPVGNISEAIFLH